MEKMPERRELNVQLPPSFLENIYRILLVANNRIQWQADELVPVGTVIGDLKQILIRCRNAGMVPIQETQKEEETKEEEPKEEETKEEETKEEETKEEETKEEDPEPEEE